MHRCLSCDSNTVSLLLDLGEQALSNRFLSRRDEPEFLFHLSLGQCSQCGLIQLLDLIPPSELKAPVDWIRYNEAEGHLDTLIETVRRMPGVSADATVGAVSFKDDTTVERFARLGHAKTWRLDLAEDLGITDPCAALETIQAALTPERAESIRQRRGPVDVLIARHILEHAHDPRAFGEALRLLVKPDGVVVFEVPDCTPALTRGDYTMPWEEHIAYYTPALFRNTLARFGFETADFKVHPYANENSLVAITRLSQRGTEPPADHLQSELEMGQKYAAGFKAHRSKVVERLRQMRSEPGTIALFGAGHLSCAWLNFLRLEGLVDIALDDHPKKQGLFLPGSRLPIRPSSDLMTRDVRLCLLSLSAESEAKVVSRHQAYLERGGVFASIFPGRENSLVQSE